MPQYNNRRPINRQAKHKLIADVYHLGLSLTNGSPTHDLEKMFSTSGMPAPPQSVRADEYEHLVAALTDLVQRVDSLERTVDVLSRENTRLRESLASLRTNEPPQRDVQPAAEDVAPTVVPNALPQQEPSGASANLEPPSEGASPSSSAADSDPTPPHAQPSLENQVLAGPPQPHLNSAPVTLMPAAPQEPLPLPEVYVGGVSPQHSVADLRSYITSRGLPAPKKSRVLCTRNGRRSFVVTMPSRESSDRLIGHQWDNGITVRPFRNSQPRERNQARPSQQTEGRSFRPGPNRPRDRTVLRPAQRSPYYSSRHSDYYYDRGHSSQPADAERLNDGAHRYFRRERFVDSPHEELYDDYMY
jgi:hypothetical protein